MIRANVRKLSNDSSSTLLPYSNNECEPIMSHAPKSENENEDLHLSDVTKADLYELQFFCVDTRTCFQVLNCLCSMQLYLDRVDPMLPLLSPARVAQSRKDTDLLDVYGRCLQHAIWTIATAFSSQFENIRDRLYTTTRKNVGQA